MALLTTNIPLRDVFRQYVIVYRVATVAGWAIEVRWTVERNPPVRARLDMIRKPFAFLHVPLGLERELVVTTLCEIALLETAAVNEGDLIQVKGPR